MATFEDFLSEGKKIQIKRKYTENHPASTVGKTASVRNSVLKAVKDGVITEEEFTKILSELSGDYKQWRTRNTKYFNVSEEGVKLSKWGLRILAELDEEPKAAVVNEKIKITKDEWPYIEFKDGGKKHKVEFDYEDIIDDHGNEGQDQYWIGKDEDGQEWQIDVYADYRGEVEEVHYDTLVKESTVTEAKNDGNLDTIADYVKQVLDDGKSFMDIGKKLKGAYKYDFSTGMMPMYIIPVSGNKIVIINKKYVENGQADRIVGDIAIGLMENMNTNMKNEINLFESFGDFIASNGILNEAINSAILRSVLSNGREGKQAKKNLSMLAKGFYGLSKVALDKIQDEDFIVSNDVSKVFKNYGGSSHVLFFISDNEKENPYYDSNNGSWNDYKIVPGGGIVLAAMSGDRQFYANEWSRWSGGRAWSKNKKGDADQIGINHKYRGWGASGLNNGKRIAEMSDRVIVINLELIRQKYSTENLRNARKDARAGATAFKSDKDFRDANRNRYHKILADKAASLPLDKMVSDAIDKLAKQISDGLTKGEKTRYQEIKIGESPKGREVKAKDASQHMSNILDDYARYVDYIRQAEESEARYGERESYYERESKNYAKSIKERINKIDSFDYAW